MKRTTASGILGSADGVTSISGIIAGGAGAGVAFNALGITAIGGALAATISMAGAEFLSEGETDWKAIQAMAVGTLAGSALPALPLLLLSGHLALILVVLISLIIGVIVGIVRWKTTDKSLLRCLTETLLVLLIGGSVGYLAGLLL